MGKDPDKHNKADTADNNSLVLAQGTGIIHVHDVSRMFYI